MLIISVLKDRNIPIARTVNTKAGEKTFYHINAYADMGGAFPVEFRFPVESATHTIAVGQYQLAQSSFKIGQYGDLEIDRFSMMLIPLPAQQHKAG